MSSIEFVPVIPAANKKHGAIAAQVLCLIEFCCRIAGPDRIEDTDGRMWRASNQTIADTLGFKRDQVQRAIKKLTDAEALVAEKHSSNGYGDQTLAYRVLPDADIWPTSRNAATSDYAKSRNGSEALTSDYAKSRNLITRNRAMSSREIAQSSITQEDLRRGEEARPAVAAAPAPASLPKSKDKPVQPPLLVAVPDPAPELSPFCSRHPEGSDHPCAACGQARKRFAAAELAAAEQDQAAERDERLLATIGFVNGGIRRDGGEGAAELTTVECVLIAEWIETGEVQRFRMSDEILDRRRSGPTASHVA